MFDLCLETLHIVPIKHLTPALMPQTDGTTIPMSMTDALTAESSSTSAMDGVEPTIHQEPRAKPESPQQLVQMDGSPSNSAAQRSEAILREAGSPETNVFYEQVRRLRSVHRIFHFDARFPLAHRTIFQIQTYISAPHPPQTRLPLPPSRHSASSHSHSHTESNQNSRSQ